MCRFFVWDDALPTFSDDFTRFGSCFFVTAILVKNLSNIHQLAPTGAPVLCGLNFSSSETLASTVKWC